MHAQYSMDAWNSFSMHVPLCHVAVSPTKLRSFEMVVKGEGFLLPTQPVTESGASYNLVAFTGGHWCRRRS